MRLCPLPPPPPEPPGKNVDKSKVGSEPASSLVSGGGSGNFAASLGGGGGGNGKVAASCTSASSVVVVVLLVVVVGVGLRFAGVVDGLLVGGVGVVEVVRWKGSVPEASMGPNSRRKTNVFSVFPFWFTLHFLDGEREKRARMHACHNQIRCSEQES